MTKEYQRKKPGARDALGLAVPDRVSVVMADVAEDLREGLLALAVGAGLQVMSALMDADVTALTGPRGRHDAERVAVRHGTGAGSVTLGGRRVGVQRPRVRAVDGSGELAVPAYELFSCTEILGRMAMERMLSGLSTRRYAVGLEPVGESVTKAATATSRSAVSRRFVKMTETALGDLLAADLSGLDLVAFMVDGVHFGDSCCVVALGIDIDGVKHPLALVEGSTENTTLVTELCVGLRERGLDVTKPILAVLDGSKALHRAVVDVFDHPVMARCQLHRDCKESSGECWGSGALRRAEDGRRVGEPGGCRGGLVAVLVQDGADFADDVADGAAADLEELGEDVLATEVPLVQDGGQDSFGVGDLLGEDPAPGAGETFATAAPVTVALPAGGLHGFGVSGHCGQFVA